MHLDVLPFAHGVHNKGAESNVAPLRQQLALRFAQIERCGVLCQSLNQGAPIIEAVVESQPRQETVGATIFQIIEFGDLLQRVFAIPEALQSIGHNLWRSACRIDHFWQQGIDGAPQP
jgi:hypothetical protein